MSTTEWIAKQLTVLGSTDRTRMVGLTLALDTNKSTRAKTRECS